MECVLRPWRAEDADDLATALNHKQVLDNLRDGLPYPYTKADAENFIAAMLAAERRESSVTSESIFFLILSIFFAPLAAPHYAPRACEL